MTRKLTHLEAGEFLMSSAKVTTSRLISESNPGEDALKYIYIYIEREKERKRRDRDRER